jgi:hypothetical protein
MCIFNSIFYLFSCLLNSPKANFNNNNNTAPNLFMAEWFITEGSLVQNLTHWNNAGTCLVSESALENMRVSTFMFFARHSFPQTHKLNNSIWLNSNEETAYLLLTQGRLYWQVQLVYFLRCIFIFHITGVSQDALSLPVPDKQLLTITYEYCMQAETVWYFEPQRRPNGILEFPFKCGIIISVWERLQVDSHSQSAPCVLCTSYLKWTVGRTWVSLSC